MSDPGGGGLPSATPPGEHDPERWPTGPVDEINIDTVWKLVGGLSDLPDEDPPAPVPSGANAPDLAPRGSVPEIPIEKLQKRVGGGSDLLDKDWVRRRREGMRGLLAAWLLAILSAVVAVGLADSAYLVFTGRTGAGDLNSVTNLLTPIVGLVGAATGFYFGSHADDHQEGH